MVIAETLAGHLVREIVVRGSRGGSLAPLADQLNHDVTHLQGQRLEGMFAELVGQVMALAQSSGGSEVPRKPVRLPPRPTFLAGREELLAEMDTRLTAGEDQGRAPVLHRLSGPEHPATLTTRGNLARWTGMAGDAAAARDQYAALLPVLERVFGPEHPETLSTRADHAYWIEQAEHGHGRA